MMRPLLIHAPPRAPAFLLAALALLAIPLLPPATATGQCVAASPALICAGDFDAYDGCQEEWSFEREATGVFVFAGIASASAGGSHDCSNVCLPFGCFRSETRGIFADASAAFVGSAHARWQQGSTCTTSVQAHTAVGPLKQNHGCPAGPPPDLPWGHLLP